MRHSRSLVSLLLATSAVAIESPHNKLAQFQKAKRTSVVREAGPVSDSSNYTYLNAKTEEFLVNGTAFPEINFDIGESYAGLLNNTPSGNSSLFFWFFPSENVNASDEITIWLNGGPGSSSLVGLMQENGPFLWQEGTYRPTPNPYSWTNVTNMVYVDQPAGIGFSPGPATATNEIDVANQFNDFFKRFVDTFDLHGRKVYITGESFAGQYIPYIAAWMLDEEDTEYFNVKGIQINDPSINSDGILIERWSASKVNSILTNIRAEYIGTEWVLTLRKAVPNDQQKDSWWQERFDALVVATGHYNVPYIPNIPGILEYDRKYPGRIWHSKHYRTAEPFTGKRVIVVGGSVSAFDALHDIRRVSKLPIISALRNPSGVFGQTPFTHPHIDNRSEISNFDAETGRITFADGSTADDVDAVLFATGFEFSFPFLPDVKPVNRRIPGLYQHVFKIEKPSLAFIGMVTGCFGIRAFEWQAVAAARVLAGHATLPSRSEMEQWEKNRLTERGDSPAFWTLMPDFEVYFEAYRALAGDPAPGTNGRILPKYDPKWADIFWDFVKTRIAWWKMEAEEAEAEAEGIRANI